MRGYQKLEKPHSFRKSRIKSVNSTYREATMRMVSRNTLSAMAGGDAVCKHFAVWKYIKIQRRDVYRMMCISLATRVKTATVCW